MSTELIYRATIEQLARHFREHDHTLHHLDIGSGSGDLIRLVRENFPVQSSCCDYTDELMRLPDQKVDIVDLNRRNGLPYGDNVFDMVTATEVIEHLEDFRKLFREVHRILKPGGMFVLSTPNILNINSRLRNLWFGFAELMGPLPVHERKMETCSGHINPVSLFYVMHALYETAFHGVDVSVDKYQRSGMGKMILFWLPIRLMDMKIRQRETVRYKTIDPSNRHMVKLINSLPLLLGRTIIVSAFK